MDEDILNKTVIYINTSNATFYNSSSYDFYYDIVDPIKRLKKECYGTNISMKDILIKKWKKRQTLEYF